MVGEDESLEQKVESGRPKKEKTPLPGWVRKARNGAIALVLVAGAGTGFGLYLNEKVKDAINDNPAVQFVETLKDIGEGLGQDLQEFGQYVSNLGFVKGTTEFVNENVIVPWNTIVPAYGNPMTIPLTSEVFVATDTYMNLRIDKSTNQFFGDLFKVVPETKLQYNGTKPVVIYDIDETVIPAKVTEKELAPGETMTLQGVSVVIEPRLNTGDIVVQRAAKAYISYDFEIAYSKPKEMMIAPFAGKSLDELADYLTMLGQRGIDFKLNKTVKDISLTADLGVNLGMPAVTVDQLAISDSRYKSEGLNTFDKVTQDLWYAPQFLAFDKFLGWLANFKGQAEAFSQIYQNVPRWTEEAKLLPGNEDIPIAELKTISAPSTDITQVPMPVYFPELWKSTTLEEITSIYMEMVKLTVNAGVNPPVSCSSDMDKLNELLTADPANKDFIKTYEIAVDSGCKIEGTTAIHVFVPAPYVTPLQQKVDTYLAEMKKASGAAAGIDYSTVSIQVEKAKSQ